MRSALAMVNAAVGAAILCSCACARDRGASTRVVEIAPVASDARPSASPESNEPPAACLGDDCNTRVRHEIDKADYLTLDGVRLTVGLEVVWRVQDAEKFERTMGADPVRVNSRIDDTLGAELRSAIAGQSAAKVESDWDALVQAVVDRANPSLAEWGIVVDGTESRAVQP
jgi:regulator of protease activity HflC (stomatin/prohibitin superfamily)